MLKPLPGAGYLIPPKVNDPSPIHYVVDAVMENWTYHQVIGETKEGNREPEFCFSPKPFRPTPPYDVRSSCFWTILTLTVR